MTHFAKLSDVKIKALKPLEKPFKAFDGQGLFLEVMPNGNKKWRFRYLYKGQDKRITLGTYPTMGLKEARTAAEGNRRLLAEKKDPLQERHTVLTPQEMETPLTFLDVAKVYGESRGSRSLRALVERHQPDLLICGHIHEGGGQGRIGRTKVFNVSILDFPREPVVIEYRPDVGVMEEEPE